MGKDKEGAIDSKKVNDLLKIMEKLHHINDIHSLLDNILFEARSYTGAEAGTIFIKEEDRLKFSYVQNEALFKDNILSNKYIYTNRTIEIDETSLSGYAAITGKPLLIEDAYKIGKDVPYTFNSYFDQISSYKTKSMLIVPMITGRDDVVGILELINAKNDKGEIKSFSPEDALFASQFAFSAAVAIERALILRDVVLKMIKISELRDSGETQNHVKRVSAYSTEIYRKWADIHDVPRHEIQNYMDVLRIASMLHDVGKVGITDTILNKKGKLTPEEFESVKLHTIYGARLFEKSQSQWEIMASEITINHHEKWDGSGYPGFIQNLNDNNIKFTRGKKAGEIPLSARIVGLADVYDALISRRVYKDAWEEERVLHHIKEESGTHFDPELVDIFISIYDVIKAIRETYSN